MIELKNVTKAYQTGDFKVKALDDVSVAFRKQEFVAIVGESGSGKTTLLNVIGGLLSYDKGDMLVDGQSTKGFSNTDWDAYRNNSVGFIFQNYNLISHLSVLSNVELGLTLSGTDGQTRRNRSVELLERVGLGDHIHKRPHQLSGGQMQRVAIARALANNPDIILADEPTGALDSKTSREIMYLLKEISKDTLIVMVTHSQELADQYADRIVTFADGQIVGDTNPLTRYEGDSDYALNKTGMSFWTALKLSFQNILTKKGRTLLTAVAASIGIIGVALVLSLSNGLNLQIENFERESLSNYPIKIEDNAFSLGALSSLASEGAQEPPEDLLIHPTSVLDEIRDTKVPNNITAEYVDYVEAIPQEYIQSIKYERPAKLNILTETANGVIEVNQHLAQMSTLPSNLNEQDLDFLMKQYDLIEGSWPEESTDMVLVINQHNQVDQQVLDALGLSTGDENQALNMEGVVGETYQLVPQDVYYTEAGGRFLPPVSGEALAEIYNNEANQSLMISGVIRLKEGTSSSEPNLGGLYYWDTIDQRFIADASESQIVQSQREADVNLVTGEEFTAEEDAGAEVQTSPEQNMEQETPPSMTKSDWLAQLGDTAQPSSIEIYPTNFEAKENIRAYLDEWNNERPEAEQVIYSDLAQLITDLSSGIMNAITLILVGFAAISLIVSMIMIGIIIYISVLERTQEIGILRALGARQKDITRVFNAESLIIGVSSGLIGLGLTYLALIPINQYIYRFTDLENVAQLNPVHALALLMISVILTLLGGFIPAKFASKKDPVEALSGE